MFATSLPRSLPRRPWTAPLAMILVIALFSFASPNATAQGGIDVVVVANRNSGDVSVVDTETLAVETYELPTGAEPMYVSHDRHNDHVLVGDRGTNAIHALDEATFEVVKTVPVGEGVAHQWYDYSTRQLWVAADESNTISVINTDTLEVEATIALAVDLTDRGGKPHDVFIKGEHAFVTVIGLENILANDGVVIVRYSTSSYEETGRIEDGAGAHIFERTGSLYVAAQGEGTLGRFSTKTLEQVDVVDIPTPHGLFVTSTREVFVANIGGGGTNAVWELDRELGEVQSVASTSVPTPHNLTVDSDRQLWVTHSGPESDQLSIIELRRGFGRLRTVTVGTNPFGIAFVNR